MLKLCSVIAKRAAKNRRYFRTNMVSNVRVCLWFWFVFALYAILPYFLLQIQYTNVYVRVLPTQTPEREDPIDAHRAKRVRHESTRSEATRPSTSQESQAPSPLRQRAECPTIPPPTSRRPEEPDLPNAKNRSHHYHECTTFFLIA